MRSVLCLITLILSVSCTTVAPEIVEVRVKTKDSRLDIAGVPICLTATEDMDEVEESGIELCAEAALYKDHKLGTQGEEACIETKLEWSVWEINGRYKKRLRIDFTRDGINLRSMTASYLSNTPEFSDASQLTLCGALFYAFARNEPSMVVPILTTSNISK